MTQVEVERDRRFDLRQKLKSNVSCCWILWEMNNLYAAFNVAETNGPKFSCSNVTKESSHELVDTIENVIGAVLEILGFESSDVELREILESIKITLVQEDNVYLKFNVE